MVIAAGAAGILFPSRVAAGGTNLVVYLDSLAPTDTVVAFDPGQALPKTRTLGSKDELEARPRSGRARPLRASVDVSNSRARGEGRAARAAAVSRLAAILSKGRPTATGSVLSAGDDDSTALQVKPASQTRSAEISRRMAGTL